MKTIELTDDELDMLEAMLEVLLDNGVYMMLRAPEITKRHREVFKKVRLARRS